jgi:hypothetical protein
VRISIGFPELGPLTIALNPNTIRYLGTDERSILHVVLRAQQAFRNPKAKIPHGVTLFDKPALKVLSDEIRDDVQLLIPGEKPTWKKLLPKMPQLLMYCPLSNDWNQNILTHYNPEFFSNHLHRDLAILELIQVLDSAEIGLQKD